MARFVPLVVKLLNVQILVLMVHCVAPVMVYTLKNALMVVMIQSPTVELMTSSAIPAVMGQLLPASALKVLSVAILIRNKNVWMVIGSIMEHARMAVHYLMEMPFVFLQLDAPMVKNVAITINHKYVLTAVGRIKMYPNAPINVLLMLIIMPYVSIVPLILKPALVMVTITRPVMVMVITVLMDTALKNLVCITSVSN
jgi:hypothetical protein